MRFSRKRYRPLDTAEQQAIHARERVTLLPLEDDRSYCYAWPESPLTQLLLEDATYAQLSQLYTPWQASGGAPQAATADREGMSPTTSTTGGAVAGSGNRIELPPVGWVGEPVKADHSASSWPEDALTLLHSLRAKTSCIITATRGDGGGQRGSISSHSLPRPLSTTEDATFSLSAVQLQDVIAARVAAFMSLDAECPDPPSAVSIPSSEQRRRIEKEVVKLEWRAWSESQRTAAALQRLLSLEAAVPFHQGSTDDHRQESCGGAEDAKRPHDTWRWILYCLWLHWRQQPGPGIDIPEEGSGHHHRRCSSSSHYQGRSITSTRVEAVASATSTPLSTSGGPPLSTRPFTTGTAPTATTTATATAPTTAAGNRHPWGAPLMPGAFLHNATHDYFLSLQQPSGPNAGSGGGGGGGLGSSSGGPSVNMASARVPRRRGVYHFLSWKVELYEAQMRRMLAGREEEEEEVEDAVPTMAKAGGGVTTASTSSALATAIRSRSGRSGGTSDAMSASSSASIAFPQSINSILSSSHIKALLTTAVLSQPLEELEMAEERRSDTLERLGLPDLRRDISAWRIWLTKV